MNRWTRRGAASSRSVLAALAVAGGVALAGCAAGQAAQTAEQQPTVDGANIELGSLAIRDIALEYPEGGLYLKGSDARLRMVVVNEGTGSDALVEVRTTAADDVTLAASGEAAGPTPSLTAPPPSPSLTSSETGLPNESKEPATPSATAGSGEPSDEPEPSASSSESPVPAPAGSGASPTPTPTPEAATSIPIAANGLVSFREDGAVVTLVGLTEQLRPTQVIEVTLVFRNAGEITTRIPVTAPEEEVSEAPTVPAEGAAEAGAEVED